MKVYLDFLKDWYNTMFAELVYIGANPDSNWDLDKLGNEYFNLMLRQLPVRERMLFTPKGFDYKGPLEKGLKYLFRTVKTGGNLNPFQSKKVYSLNEKDDLLSHFGIRHFHLGDGFERSGLRKRTKELAFAYVTNDHFYFCGIYDHDSWHNIKPLDILDENWPHLFDQYTADVEVPKNIHTLEMRKSLRKNKINTFTRLDSGKIIYPPYGGVSLSGLNNNAIQNFVSMKRAIKGIESCYRSNATKLYRYYLSLGIPVKPDMVFSLILSPNAFLIIETKTGTVDVLKFNKMGAIQKEETRFGNHYLLSCYPEKARSH